MVVWDIAEAVGAVVDAGAGIGASLSQHARQALGARGLAAARVHGHASHERLSTGGGYAGVASNSQLAKAAHGVGVGVGAESGGCHQTGAWEGALQLAVVVVVVVVAVVMHSNCRGCANMSKCHKRDDKQ